MWSDKVLFSKGCVVTLNLVFRCRVQVIAELCFYNPCKDHKFPPISLIWLILFTHRVPFVKIYAVTLNLFLGQG